MRSLSLVGLAFLVSGLLGFCESGKSGDVFVTREMLQEFQERFFDRINNLERDIKERFANKADKTLTDDVFLNDTAELEQRVEDLEVAMATVQDDVSELETDVSLIDGRLLNLETDVSLLTENVINVESEVFDNQEAIFDLVLDVDNLQETTFVHSQQIETLQSADVQLDQRVSALENGNITSNTTDLEIRVAALEENVSDQAVAIANLQEADIGFEQRIEDLEDNIVGNWTACESSPCDNGATCVDVNVDTFICVCRHGYFGVTCSESYGDFTFLAGVSANTVSPIPDPVLFDDDRINPGDHYNPTTGIYTISLDGTYEFYVQIESYRDSDNDWYFRVYVDGVSLTYTRHDASGSSSSNEYVSAGSIVLVDLSAGQEVWVEANGLDGLNGSSSGQMYSWFSGHLISAD